MKIEKKMFIYLIFLILIFSINLFLFKVFPNDIISIIFLIVNVAVTILLLGYEKNKFLKSLDANLIIFAYGIVYYILIYTIGIISGYAQTIYSHELLMIIKNIFPIILIIISEEILRYQIVSKVKQSKNERKLLLLMIIALILFDIRNVFPMDLDFNTILDNLSITILPAITRNIALTAIVYLGGYKPTIFYRLIMEIPIYIVPIYPNLGPYINGIIGMIFPIIVLFVVKNILVKKRDFFIRKIKKNKIISKILLFPVIVILVVSIMLVSNYFKYYALSIVSNSMYPELSVGDVVIVKKLNEEEKNGINIGDVLVYSKNDRIIVHRLIYTSNLNDREVYITKGDNNDDTDNYIINKSDIIGIAEYNIPIIGYPSVWLNEMR